MKHFINIKDIPAKDLRSIIESSKKRKKKVKKRKNDSELSKRRVRLFLY